MNNILYFILLCRYDPCTLFVLISCIIFLSFAEAKSSTQFSAQLNNDAIYCTYEIFISCKLNFSFVRHSETAPSTSQFILLLFLWRIVFDAKSMKFVFDVQYLWCVNCILMILESGCAEWRQLESPCLVVFHLNSFINLRDVLYGLSVTRM